MPITQNDLLDRLEQAMREGTMEVTFKINWLNNKHQGFKVTMKGQFEDDGGKGKRFFSGGESLQHCVERLITDIVRTRIM